MVSRSSLVTCALVGCAAPTASVPQGGPRGLRAPEHREVAERHDQVVREALTRPEVAPAFETGPRALPLPAPAPWYRSWHLDEHRRAAAGHRATAGVLESAYQQACDGMSAREIRTSPLARHAIASWETSSGAIVYLSPDAGTPDQLRAELDCHRAWLMVTSADPGDAPLDLPGLSIDARGDEDGITLSIAVRDRAWLPELHRRLARELETAGRQAASSDDRT